MGEKEKKFLGILGLFISITIFIIIISYTFSFDNIKVNIQGNKMVKYLSERQYERFFENLSCDNFPTMDEFTQYQDTISQMLGEIKSYKYKGTYRNKNSEDGKTAMNHHKIHTDVYYDNVLKMLQKANDRDEAIQILDDIRQMLLDGTFSIKK